MATQLETISEETTAPAPATTPARVTADPPKTKPATEKNPGRLAAGKRLAQYNRLARKAKKKSRGRKTNLNRCYSVQCREHNPVLGHQHRIIQQRHNCDYSWDWRAGCLRFGRVLPMRSHYAATQARTSSTTSTRARPRDCGASPISNFGKTRR